MRLCSQINGTLERIYVDNGARVKQGDLIAKMTSPISEHALTHLQEFLHQVQTSLNKPSEKSLVSADTLDQDYIFGDIQGEYGKLLGLYQSYKGLSKSVDHKTRL